MWPADDPIGGGPMLPLTGRLSPVTEPISARHRSPHHRRGLAIATGWVWATGYTLLLAVTALIAHGCAVTVVSWVQP